MPITLTASHIAGSLEPQKKNNFVFIIGVGGGIISKALDTFPIPEDSNPSISIPYGNERRKVAGAARFSAVTFDVKDFIDTPVIQQLMVWFATVYDARTGIIGYAKNYKKEGTVRLLGPDGATSREWRLIGVWPTRVNPGGGDMSANVDNKISVSLRVDKIIERNL